MLEIGKHYYVKLSHVPRDSHEIQGIAGDIMRVCAIEEFCKVHNNPSIGARHGYIPVFKCNCSRRDPKVHHGCTSVSQMNPRNVGLFPIENLTEMTSQHANFFRHIRESASNRAVASHSPRSPVSRGTIAPETSNIQSPPSPISSNASTASYTDTDGDEYKGNNDSTLGTPTSAKHSSSPPTETPVESQVFHNALASSTLEPYTMAYSFSAESRGELSVRAGDTVVPLTSRLAKVTEGWTLVLHVDSRSGIGHVGHVPTAFIKKHETIAARKYKENGNGREREEEEEDIGGGSSGLGFVEPQAIAARPTAQSVVQPAARGVAADSPGHIASNAPIGQPTSSLKHETLLPNPEDPVTLERLYNEIYRGAHDTGYSEGYTQGRLQQSEYLLARLRGTLNTLIERAERNLTSPPESLLMDGTVSSYPSSVERNLNAQLEDIFLGGNESSLAPPLLATPLILSRNRFQESVRQRHGSQRGASLALKATGRGWTHPEYLSHMQENRVLITSYSRLLIELDEIEKELGLATDTMSHSVRAAIDRTSPLRHYSTRR